MEAFACLWSMLKISQTPILIGCVLWCFFGCCSWVLSARAVYHIYKTKYQTCIKKDKKVFFVLIMAASIAISMAQFGVLPAALFWYNQFHPNTNIDYEHDLNCGTLGFYQTIQIVFAPICGITNDISYALILTVYYNRLHLIFKSSMFELSKNKQILFILLIVLMIFVSILRIIAMFLHEYIGGYTHFHLWNIYVIFYAIISIYIFICMKQQFDCLLKFLEKSNINKNNNCKNEKLLRIESMMRRFIALAYCCLSSTMIVALFSIVLNQIFSDHLVKDSNNTVWVDFAYWTLYFGDNLINNICLSLQYNFGYNNKVYSIICQRCEPHQTSHSFQSSIESDQEKVAVDVEKVVPTLN